MTLAIDTSLVAAAHAGDPAALDALLRAARPHIRRQAERRCIAHAEDATQETLLTVHRKLPTLRSVAAFPAWVVRIVSRICYGLVAPLWERIEALKEADSAAALEGLSVEARLDLARAVDALPPAYRGAIIMHYFDDLPIADIAVRLGISEGATRVRLHRGREWVRQRLSGEEGAA